MPLSSETTGSRVHHHVTQLASWLSQSGRLLLKPFPSDAWRGGQLGVGASAQRSTQE